MVLVGLYGIERGSESRILFRFLVLHGTHDTVNWWRRRELNPRPQTLHLKATTCLVSLLFNPITADRQAAHELSQ